MPRRAAGGGRTIEAGGGPRPEQILTRFGDLVRIDTDGGFAVEAFKPFRDG
ncbi:hypothetical protein AB0D49_28830 [Streptomyces sp. NPDC048290]|uniref:hypothetical protein n=1 Tax=Streptomyces sp. NPDC048290 TaxID=3155811 RepID=UPI003417A646